MSLIPFHRFLIATAIVFCGGFSGWALYAFVNGGRPVMLALTVVFAAAAMVLGLYLGRLRQILKLPPRGR